MSQDLSTAALPSQRVFPAEIRGRALLIRPRGGALEFSAGEISTEMQRLKAVIEQPEIEHVILNLGGSNYYGSEMIGLFVQLGQHARECGGQSALCELSEDMRGTITIMKLDRMWLLLDSESQAIRTLADEAPPGLLHNRVTQAVLGVLLLAAVGLTIVLTRPDRVEQLQEIHAEAAAVWLEVVERRSEDLTPPQWKLYAADATRRMNEAAERLDSPALQDHPAAESLRNAIRNGLLPVLQDRDGVESKTAERLYHAAMQQARTSLDDSH